VVEILLKNLDQTQKAFDLVRRNPTSAGASLIAEYCQNNLDYRGTIEFLLIANKIDDSFKVASQQNMMDLFTSFLGESISTEDALKVAQYYDKLTDFGKAGKFYSLAGNYSRALKLFLQCGTAEIESAIEVVGKSQNEQLTHQLIDFLVGEKDGIPKDANHIYRLYMALKKYEEAAKTALIITNQEMELGKYEEARQVVAETIRSLEDSNMKVNLQLKQLFILLHSYHLAKLYLQQSDDLSAARLLLRVAANVSKFKNHVVQILTSAVIICTRAKLKKDAYEYAVTLVKPDYRSKIDVKYKSKIEGIVRKKSAINEEQEPPEETSPCPISGLMIPVTQLECPTTRDAIPMCIISGKHMVLDDWCFCPVSKFPALYSEYVRYIREMTKKLGSASLDSVQDDQLQKMKSPDRSDHSVPQTDEIEENNNSSSFRNNKSLVAATDMYLSAPDPVMGKSVSVNDLILCTKEDAIKYIQRYNNVVEKQKENKTSNNKEDSKESDGNKDSGNNSPTKSKDDGGSGRGGDGQNEEDGEASSPYGKFTSKDKKNSNENMMSSKGSTKENRAAKAKFDRIQRSKRKRNADKSNR
jgi:tetratricopeptide (TPR) repeat protein